MRKRAVCSIVLAFVFGQGCAALAEPFIDDRAGVSDEYFHNSFANHNNSLDNLHSSMRSDLDYSSLSGSHGKLTHAQSNQTDTWQTSQDTNSNTLTEMVLSGGLHNSNGSNGASGLSSGNMGMMYGSSMYGSSSGQVAPDSWGSGGANYGSGNYYGGGGSSSVNGW